MSSYQRLKSKNAQLNDKIAKYKEAINELNHQLGILGNMIANSDCSPMVKEALLSKCCGPSMI